MGESPMQRQTARRPVAAMLAAMTPFFALLDLPRRLHSPAVRDLAWTLVSPPLLNDAREQRHPLAASAWAADPQRLADWLLALQRDPTPLERWLQVPERRLGRYSERLWRFALERAPGVSLHAGNLAVRRGGRTVGELDLLLEDDEGLQHIELAVKFYLGDPAALPGRDWLGPDRRDRLDLKRAHLLEHQLPLGRHPDTLALLAGRGLGAPRSRYWLTGYLFHPAHAGFAAPPGANPAHLRGRWLRRSDWPALRGQAHASRWVELPRLAWLAPAQGVFSTDGRLEGRFLPEPELDAASQPAPPRLLARLTSADGHPWNEVERVFLVDDDWSGRAA